MRQLGHVVSQMRVIRLSLKAAINTTSMRVGLSPGRLVVIDTRAGDPAGRFYPGLFVVLDGVAEPGVA